MSNNRRPQNFIKAERDYRAALVEASSRFAILMTRAVAKGKERAVAGTFVDPTPPTTHKRIRNDSISSGCGSPAAMCAG